MVVGAVAGVADEGVRLMHGVAVERNRSYSDAVEYKWLFQFSQHKVVSRCHLYKNNNFVRSLALSFNGNTLRIYL